MLGIVVYAYNLSTEEAVLGCQELEASLGYMKRPRLKTQDQTAISFTLS